VIVTGELEYCGCEKIEFGGPENMMRLVQREDESKVRDSTTALRSKVQVAPFSMTEGRTIRARDE
jgi:hypothetical protein